MPAKKRAVLCDTVQYSSASNDHANGCRSSLECRPCVFELQVGRDTPYERCNVVVFVMG